MKRLIIPVIILLITSRVCAQKTDAIDITSIVAEKKKENGSALIIESSGKCSLYAKYKNSKLTEFYAKDASGKKLEVVLHNTSGTKDRPKQFCQVCTMLGDYVIDCYLISCDNLPKPKDKKAIR